MSFSLFGGGDETARERVTAVSIVYTNITDMNKRLFLYGLVLVEFIWLILGHLNQAARNEKAKKMR
jgi:hypothetical protein